MIVNQRMFPVIEGLIRKLDSASVGRGGRAFPRFMRREVEIDRGQTSVLDLRNYHRFSSPRKPATNCNRRDGSRVPP